MVYSDRPVLEVGEYLPTAASEAERLPVMVVAFDADGTMTHAATDGTFAKHAPNILRLGETGERRLGGRGRVR